MGMFDYISCRVPLPHTDVPPPAGPFQTRDTPDQLMSLYTISQGGLLTRRASRLEVVPEAERPDPGASGFTALIGRTRTIFEDEERVPFHGDICFHATNHPDVGVWEYRARFTEDRLSGVELVEYRAPEGRDVNAEIRARRAVRPRRTIETRGRVVAVDISDLRVLSIKIDTGDIRTPGLRLVHGPGAEALRRPAIDALASGEDVSIVLSYDADMPYIADLVGLAGVDIT